MQYDFEDGSKTLKKLPKPTKPLIEWGRDTVLGTVIHFHCADASYAFNKGSIRFSGVIFQDLNPEEKEMHLYECLKPFKKAVPAHVLEALCENEMFKKALKAYAEQLGKPIRLLAASQVCGRDVYTNLTVESITPDGWGLPFIVVGDSFARRGVVNQNDLIGGEWRKDYKYVAVELVG